MQIKRFASTVVMALAMTAQFAYAAVILQVDIADPNKIKFIATGENALINNSEYTYNDGITLREFFTDTPDIEIDRGMEGDLVVPPDGFALNYDFIYSVSKALVLHVEENFDDDDNDSDPAVVNRQKFTTSSPAFSGMSTVKAFGSTVTLKGVGEIGEVVAGYEETDFYGSIGQWEIIDSTSSTDKSVDPAILWLLLKPQPSDDEG